VSFQGFLEFFVGLFYILRFRSLEDTMKDSSMAVDPIRKTLSRHRQEHLLGFWRELNPAQQDSLIAQIEDLDWEDIEQWVHEIVLDPKATINQKIAFEPAPSYGTQPEDARQRHKYLQAKELGKSLIAQGKVACFVVAGGQGTRLGFDGPKGNYPISPVKNKTLFQIFAETISETSKRYDVACPWYVMTSPLNHSDTVEIFETNEYYGLGRDNVVIFQQGTLPNFGFDGKILMADKGSLALSPDGHGGCIKALHRSGALEDMKRRGIEHLSYWQVDNPLVKLLDPLFIGLHVLDRAEMSSKAVIKNAPREKVGNFCLVGGKITVIEYSDLPDELAEKQNSDGSLVFRLGSIAIHIIDTRFIERLGTKSYSLPLHRAVKKIPYIDSKGRHVEPTRPNGVKLESFIFDALPLATNSIILEIDRAEEFAPTKNATGVDSAESCRAMMVERAARWLEAAGIKVPRKTDGSPDCVIDMAASFALEPDDVKAKRQQVPPIKPGDTIYLA
jgi:UDP-N-acetylglucosamine/UDP-N-acetylgalactosamine diphosphorylase